MASPPLLNVEELLAPIPGDRPAGSSVPFEVREELDRARKEDDPNDYAPDDPLRPEKLVRADWPGITRRTQSLLTQTSKDLQTAARLLEALVWQNGFPGLRDGLLLLRRLIEQCWDRLYPELDDPPDLEVRAAPFLWLDDADRGARFPNTVRRVPMLSNGPDTFAWQDWRRSQENPAKREAFEKAIQSTPWERCQQAVDDLTAARDELTALVAALNGKMGQAAPALTNLRGAIEACLLLAQQVLQRKGPAPAAATNGAATDASPVATAGAPAASPARTREEVYRRLAQAADQLQQLEPHSPIPYLIQRAVSLGALPFPDLIRALIREPNVLAELNRELGIKEASESVSTGST
jgi:type VI secretion system protein ImpA